MNKLIANINNAYTARHAIAYIPLKKKYFNVLYFLMRKNLIAYYKLSIPSAKNKSACIMIKLNYFKNKPLFFLKVWDKASNPRYKKVFHLKQMHLKETFNYVLLNTSTGLEHARVSEGFNSGGKLLMSIWLLNKNIDG